MVSGIRGPGLHDPCDDSPRVCFNCRAVVKHADERCTWCFFVHLPQYFISEFPGSHTGGPLLASAQFAFSDPVLIEAHALAC